MKTLFYTCSTVLILLIACQHRSDLSESASEETKKPNILLVVADDMGWTDLGCYGSKINTPNLDRLAQQGIQFTDFHTSVSCSPTRSMLLTGTDNHLAGLGNMGELLTPNQKGKPGYEGHLNNRVVTLAEVLKSAEYHTYMAGKWHLGHDLDNIPGARGFDKSMSLLFGGASHYSDRSGIIPIENPAEYSLDRQKLNELPDDFYSSRSYTDFLIEAIRSNKDDGKPFLAYLAFTAPHDPLQVPEPWMSKYKGKFDDGYERLRKERIDNVKARGLIPDNAETPRMHPATKPWDSYSAEEHAFESKKMEVYAGMVDNMDYHFGRMVNFLKDIGEYDNTIIIFISDNGPNPWYNEQYPGNADGVYLSRFDNRIENIGNPSSHIAYGIGWASASAGPLDYFKMTVGEGGIRTPLIMAGPNIQPGKVNHNFGYVMDLMPTILDLVNVEHPREFNGNEVLSMKGRSLKSMLSDKSEAAYGPDEYIGGEMLGGKWIRKGEFKATWVPKPYGPDEWKLYNITIDPGETSDLSDQHPELLQELKNVWQKRAQEVGVVPG